MTTKRFRAATMREALEQAKVELGDEALVLDTKRVKAGGVLGLGAREMIEVRVAAGEPAPADKSDASAIEAEEIAPSGSVLNLRGARTTPVRVSLTDDAPAAPRPATSDEAEQASTAPGSKSRSPVLGALAARAAAPTVSDPGAKPSAEIAQARDERETVELAPTAPQSARRHAGRDGEAASVLSSEIERLHAEMREMKFVINRLATRPAYNFDPRAASNSSAAASAETDAALYESPYYETFMRLTETGIAPELARRIARPADEDAGELTHDSAPDLDAFARLRLDSYLASHIDFASDPTAAGAANNLLVFVGPTGVGKTTTIAKLAARAALRQRRRVELITLDTYRIAAVEQLKTYAEIIGAGFHVAGSVLELDALTSRLSAESLVLVDTTGRSPHDLADQLELADYLRSREEMLKCLVLQATTNAADAHVSHSKFALYGANRLVLTKLDETSRPGACVEIAADARLPLLYLCAGQRVPEDLEHATAAAFARRVLRTPEQLAARAA